MICIFKVIHYCYLMHLIVFRICVLKYVDLILFILSASGLAWQAALKKATVKLNLLTNIDMLFMVGKGIRSGIWHTINMRILITDTWNVITKIRNHMLSVGAKIICMDEKFVKIYFKVIFNGLKKHFNLIKIL